MSSRFEPFFFRLEGKDMVYLALEPYTNQTYIATGTFVNLHPSKQVYYLDGRYTDQMNETSMFHRVKVRVTHRYSPAKTKRFMVRERIRLPDPVTLFVSDDTYWFVKSDLLKYP